MRKQARKDQLKGEKPDLSPEKMNEILNDEFTLMDVKADEEAAALEVEALLA
jgi:hypothetical protein